MILGKIAGRITATICHPATDGRKLLIVDKLHPDGSPTGEYVIALDVIDAGAGETVLVLDEGNSARQILDEPDWPVRSVVVGIVDEIALT